MADEFAVGDRVIYMGDLHKRPNGHGCNTAFVTSVTPCGEIYVRCCCPAPLPFLIRDEDYFHLVHADDLTDLMAKAARGELKAE